MRDYMANPIISEDGHWMWTGSEWIPTQPRVALVPQEKSSSEEYARGNAIQLQNHNLIEKSEVNQDLPEGGTDATTEHNKPLIVILMILIYGIYQIFSFWGNWSGAGGTIWLLLPVLGVLGVIALVSFGILLILDKFGIINLQWRS